MEFSEPGKSLTKLILKLDYVSVSLSKFGAFYCLELKLVQLNQWEVLLKNESFKNINKANDLCWNLDGYTVTWAFAVSALFPMLPESQMD